MGLGIQSNGSAQRIPDWWLMVNSKNEVNSLCGYVVCLKSLQGPCQQETIGHRHR